MILLFVSVISGYFAVTFPFSTLSSTGFGSGPSDFILSCTYSKPAGISSSTFTSVSLPFSTVFSKLIRYSTSSLTSVHGYSLSFQLVIHPLYVEVVSRHSVSLVVYSIFHNRRIHNRFANFSFSFTFALKTILLSFVSVISGYSASTMPFSLLHATVLDYPLSSSATFYKL